MITNLYFKNKIVEKYGLKEVVLKNLNSVILISGPNGAGKTRFFKLLTEVYTDYTKKIKVKIIDKKNKNIEKEEDSFFTFDQEYASDQFPKIHYIKYPSNFITDKFTQSNTEKIDFNVVLENINDLVSSQATFSYHLSHQNTPDEIKKSASSPIQNKKKINNLISELLNDKLNGIFEFVGKEKICPVIFNRNFVFNELSEGQKVIFLWIFNDIIKSDVESKRIILLENPETYLHSDALIKLIKLLINIVNNKKWQLWISTHSISLISYLSINGLYYMKDGGLSKITNNVSPLINGIIGGDDLKEKITTLLSEPEIYSFYNFTLQCLLSPKASNYKKNDPQIIQFINFIENNRNNVHLLDYYPGKGRFALGIIDHLDTHQNPNKSIIYHGLLSKKDNDECNTICQSNIDNLYSKYNQLSIKINDIKKYSFDCNDYHGKMDLVLLCNTLHEIPICEWQNHFELISKVLKNNGYLIIMEDLLIPIGELPNKEGFILLNYEEISCLFNKQGVHLFSQEKNRLICVVIEKNALEKFSVNNVSIALKGLQNRCLREIKNIRENINTNIGELHCDEGRKQALYSMLYLNSVLSLEKCSNISS